LSSGEAGISPHWIAVSNKAKSSSSAGNASSWTKVTKKTPAPAPEVAAQQAPPKPRSDDFPSLGPNLNLPANQLKSNFVNLKANLKNKEENKKASSVTIAMEKSWPAPPEPAPKTKTKKKKKGSEDSVKKKSPEKISEEKSGNALVVNSGPPLPTAQDWFSSESANNNNNHSDDPDEDELEHTALHFSKMLSSKKPPPGFSALNNVAKPPPGFESRQNGLTFTNSTGDIYLIPPGYSYLPPPDFEARNSSLVTKVNEILLNDTNLSEFRMKSASFRNGQLTGDAYFEHCKMTMGEMGMKQVLPELLVLLPDIRKQQELYSVLVKHQVGVTGKTKLEHCPVCRQVVMANDIKLHLTSHVLDFRSCS